MNLPRLSSITKKIFVALFGGFLLVFLLFHASANLLILANDGGQAYSAFCHFMGTNLLIKVFEIGLLAIFALHIIITLVLAIQNRKARGTQRYHQPSKTKTAAGSKLAIWTGILILCFLVLHFCNFYFAKIGLVKGTYMVKVEEVVSNESISTVFQGMQYGMSPEEMVEAVSAQDPAQAEDIKAAVDVVEYLNNPNIQENIVDKYLHKIPNDKKAAFKAAGIETEPDFYWMARDLFTNPIYLIIYLVCFVVLWFHLRHAFESCMQTLGLNNYKYNRAIEIIGILLATVICLAFTITAVGVLVIA